MLNYIDIKELKEQYKRYCDKHEECRYCELNKDNCLIDFVYHQGRTDAIKELEEDY